MKTKIKNKDKIDKKELEKKSAVKWYITVFIMTFVISLFLSFVATAAINDLQIIPAIIILLVVILIGVVFDVFAIAITVGEEEKFHAKATKKLKGAKAALTLIKHSPKVANFCADVIGDICGVLSGAVSAIIAIKLTSELGFDNNIQYFMGAIVASLTVGGKAIGKTIAKNHSTSIVYAIARTIDVFVKK